MKEYNPEQLVDKINDLANQYAGIVKVKTESDRTNFLGTEEYNLSINLDFELDGCKVEYLINRVNGTHLSAGLRQFVAYNHRLRERISVSGSHQLTFNNNNCWVYIDRTSFDRRKDDKVKRLVERWSQKVKEYLHQEIPEIMELVFQKPAPRTEGLDALLKELGE